MWWFLLVHVGMRSRQILISKKTIFASLLLFWIIKIGFSLIYSTHHNWAVIKSFYIIGTHQIDRELSKTPPDYTEAFTLATTISKNKKLPPYIRYVHELKMVAYYLAIRLYAKEKYFIDELLHKLAERKYDDVRQQIKKRISMMDNKQEFLLDYDEELKEINDLSWSDMYNGEIIDLGISVWTLPEAGYTKGEKEITILLPLYYNFISLFP